MNTEHEKLTNILKELGVSASGAAEAAEKMFAFEDLVLERNEIINLTAITEREEFFTKHLVDSVSCYGWPEIDGAKRVVDIGTGAGFPGVPLAILYPKKSFTLIDSLGKRTDFITEATEKLGIINVRALHMRAEDAGQDKELRETFDICVTRAVAAMPVLEEYCLPLVKVGGYMYAYKTKNAEGELTDGELARNLLGGSREAESRVAVGTGASSADLPFSRRIFIIRKNRPTPLSYPRKAGTPSKVPL
jgi:16S rRNA (guanine527-N7)-methyltransferase